MAIAGIIICIAFVIMGYFFEKKMIINPITVFCGIWSIVLSFSILGFYTMPQATDNTYKVILVGTICFVMGYYFDKKVLHVTHFKIGKHSRNYYDKKFEAIPRYQLLYVLLIICIFYAAISFVGILRNVETFNLYNVQKLLQSGEYSSGQSAWLLAFAFFVIHPAAFAIPAITAVDFWYGRRDKKLIILTIVMLAVRLLGNANRTSVVLLLIYMIVIAYIYMFQHRNRVASNDSDKNVSKRIIRRYIALIIAVGIIAFVLMTMSRGARLFRNIYLNLAIPLRMYEIWAEDIESSYVYGYGMASLLGFVYPVFYFIKNFFGLSGIPEIVQSMYDWTMLTDSKWVWPGENIKANAYVSIFWSLYVDARWVGVVIGMFLFGVVASRSYNSAISLKGSIRQKAIFCMIIYAILFSFIRFQFSQFMFALAFLFIAFPAYKMVPKRTGEKL